ncbi:PH and SEC7 domain-containing protein 4 [Echeneis naucrates]|uniref:PH and SEC7 domain-containing protein 4-like n=1 Tax=Echeneis naucrates TaxID=173247 RepID=A0A665WA03_ECHNA|nr:PH and SEC7 domain-containing protein 4-like [Echeneis naucrates]
MEEELLYSSLLDHTDSVLQQHQQESLTSKQHQHINGEKDPIVWGETEVQINQAHGTDQVNLTPRAGEETPDEAEQWEQMPWSVRPMTCTSPRISCATVQWDMPDPFTETPSFITDKSLANELNYEEVTSSENTSLSLHQIEDDHAELLIQAEREEQDGFDSELLKSNREWIGNSSEPCDAADVQQPSTQEKEGSTHELTDSNNEIPLRTDAGDEKIQSSTLVTVETVNLSDSLEGTDGSENEVDSLVKLEEEQEEPGILLTGQGDSEEQQTSANGVEIDEKNVEGVEEEEEQSVEEVFCTENTEETEATSSLGSVEVSIKPLQPDDTGLTKKSDKLTDLQQSVFLEESWHSGTEEDTEILHRSDEDSAEDPIEEPEMCKHEAQNADSEQSEAVNYNEEASAQEVENAGKIKNSQDVPELTENLDERSCLEQQDSDQTSSGEKEVSSQAEQSVSEQLEITDDTEQIHTEASYQIEEQDSDGSEQLGQTQHLEESLPMELAEQPGQLENGGHVEEPTESEQTICAETEHHEDAEQQEKTESIERAEKSLPALSEQLVQPENSNESETTEQLSPETEVTEQTELNQESTHSETLHPEEIEGSENGDLKAVEVNGEQTPETVVPHMNHMNGGEVDRDMACRLAEQLYKLDGIQRIDVVKHLDKDNDFSRAVGEEYLKLFDFTGKILDHALRSFLKVVVVIGESQERERVLQHFACRYHQCNTDSFSSSGAVFALTCALMLLNTDLHGQHVGKSMSSAKFVSNLDGMNDGENFNKDLLKSLYNSIKSEPLEWAVDDEELKSSGQPEEDSGISAALRSKSNPFQDVPHDAKAAVVKEGFLKRKLHADIDGKRTPWGRRGWKTFYGVLKGMVLYLQKDDYRRDQQTSEEVVSVHHSLAEQAVDYTKKPHVFRLQTADWRIFLFQASSKVEMNSWISRINLVSALHSSPPFPAAVGSQRKFFRPILPASQSDHTLDRQLQSHAGMLESFKADLLYLQQNMPEGRKARAKELEEHRVRAEYLQHEMSRYEIYIQVLEGWKNMEKTENDVSSNAHLNAFDKAMCAEAVGEQEEVEEGLKKSHSSPSLELELAPPTVIKVRRNISERRTYRKTIIPRWNKDA